MKLKLRDLLSVVTLDSICLYYNAGDGEFKDIYKGSAVKVPEELLCAEVQVVSAKKKDVLDIQLNAEDIPEKRKCS